MTREQMRLMQENFVALETSWKADKSQLEASLSAVEQHRMNEVTQLHAGLTQYQAAYAQIHAQYEAASKQLQAQKHEQLSEQLSEQLKQMAASSGEQQLELIKSLQESITSQVSQVNWKPL